MDCTSFLTSNDLMAGLMVVISMPMLIYWYTTPTAPRIKLTTLGWDIEEVDDFVEFGIVFAFGEPLKVQGSRLKGEKRLKVKG